MAVAAAAAAAAAAATAWTCHTAGLAVLALCEVAKVPSLQTKHANGDIWVAPEEESVVTRFLFAFPDGILSGHVPTIIIRRSS